MANIVLSRFDPNHPNLHIWDSYAGQGYVVQTAAPEGEKPSFDSTPPTPNEQKDANDQSWTDRISGALDSLYNAFYKTNPEENARFAKASENILLNQGTLWDTSEEARKDFADRVEAEQAKPDWNELIRSNPQTAVFLTERGVMPQAHNDIENISVVEDVTNFASNAIESAFLTHELGMIGARAMDKGQNLETMAEDDRKRVKAIRARMAVLEKDLPQNPLSPKGMAAGALGMMPYLLAMARGAAIGAGTGMVAGTTLFPGAGTAVGGILGMVAGAGAAYNAANDYGRQQQGVTYLNSLENGATMDAAKRGGQTSYILNSLLSTPITAEATFTGVNRGLGQLLSDGVLRNSAASVITAATLGVGMASSDLLAQKVAFSRAADWSLDDFQNLAVAGAANALPAGLIHTRSIAPPVVKSINNAVQKSRLLKNNPEMAADFVNRGLRGTPAEKVQADAQTVIDTLNTLSNEEAEKTLNHLDTNVDELTAAAVGGGEVEFDTARLSTLPPETLEKLMNIVHLPQEKTSPFPFNLQLFGTRSAMRNAAVKYMNGDLKGEELERFKQSAMDNNVQDLGTFARQIFFGDDVVDYLDNLRQDEQYRRFQEDSSGLADIDSELEKKAAKEKRAIRTYIEAEIENEPFYKAEEVYNLNLKSFGTESVKETARKYREGELSEENMEVFDNIARENGFDNGDQFAQACFENYPRDVELESRVSKAEAEIDEIYGLSNNARARQKTLGSDDASNAIIMEANAIARQGLGMRAILTQTKEGLRHIEGILKTDKLSTIKLSTGDSKAFREGIREARELKKAIKEAIRAGKKDPSTLAEAGERLQDDFDALREKLTAERDRLNQEEGGGKNPEKTQKKLKAADEMLKEYQDIINQLKSTSRDEATERKSAWEGTIHLLDARIIARNTIESLPVSQARDWNGFMEMEENSRQISNRAYRDGNYGTSLDYKTKELIAHEQAKVAVPLDREVHEIEGYFQQLAHGGVKKFKSTEAFAQAAGILSRFGITARGYMDGLSTMTLPEYVRNMQGKTGRVAIPEWLYDDPNGPRGSYRDLTIQQLRDVRDAINNIRMLDNRENSMNTGAKKSSIAGAVRSFVSEVSAYSGAPKRSLANIARGKRTVWEHIKDFLQDAEMLETAVINMAGKDSKMYEFFVDRLQRCADAEANVRDEYVSKWQKLFNDTYTKKEQRLNGKTLYKSEEMGISMTKWEMINILMNMGCDGNFQKLFNTVPAAYKDTCKLWTPQSVLKFLSENLDERDVRFAQQRVDLLNELWPRVEKFEREYTGIVPTKVEGRTFTVQTRDGKTVTFKGKYFPLSRSREATRTSGDFAERFPALYNNTTNPVRAMTRNGYTKDRSSADYMVNVEDPTVDLRHIKDVIHDLHFREYVEDFNRIMDTQEFADTLRRWGGDNAYDMFDKQRKIIAGNTYASAMAKELSWFTTVAKRVYGGAALCLRLGVATQNLANILLYAGSQEGFGWTEVGRAVVLQGPRFWINAVFNHKAETSIRQRVYNESAFMRDRGRMPDQSFRELQDALIEGKYKNNPLGYAAKLSQNLMTWTDEFWAIPIWLEAKDAGIRRGMDNASAIRYADSVIRGTIGSGRKHDQSRAVAAGSNEASAILTQFYTFFNVELNRWMRETGLLRRNGAAGIPRMAAFLAVRTLIFPLVSNLLAFKTPDEDEDPIAWFFANAVNMPMSNVLVVKDIAPMLVNSIAGVQSYSYRAGGVGSIMAQTATATKKAGETIHDVITDEPLEPHQMEQTVEAVTNTITMWMGSPQQINAYFWNAYDWYTNGMELEPRDLFSRRPQKERYPKTARQIRAAARRKLAEERRKRRLRRQQQ